MDTSIETIKITLHPGDAISAVLKAKYVTGEIQEIKSNSFSIKTAQGKTSEFSPIDLLAVKTRKVIKMDSIARIQTLGFGSYGGRSLKTPDESDYDVFTTTKVSIFQSNSESSTENKLIVELSAVKTTENKNLTIAYSETTYTLTK